jgi:hypothetical protein
MDSQYKAFRIALLLGIFGFPSFGLLDLLVYPDFIVPIWSIRAVTVVIYLTVFIFLQKIKEKYLFPLITATFLCASFAISLMCYVTGDGFQSPYYAGLFVVIMIATIFSPIRQNYYLVIIAICLVQHFTLLLSLPWQWKDLGINVFFLGTVSLSGFLVRVFIYRLVSEVKTLKGFLPICAHCKKIRDDKGYWNQIEKYIAEHSGTEFTHSICPDCAEILYGIKIGKSDNSHEER